MRVIITGSTGMVGKGVLLECLESEDVQEVFVVNRSPLEEGHPKLKEILTQDFYDLSDIEDQLTGYDACYFCLGTSAVGKTKEQYTRITYDLTMSFARTLLKVNPEITFIYVTGQGTDSEMNSRMMWANVKGKTENDLLAMDFKSAYMFRPGAIIPKKGVQTKVGGYQFLYNILRPFYPLLLKIKTVTDTVRVGQAMLNATKSGYPKHILEPEDINQLAG